MLRPMSKDQLVQPVPRSAQLVVGVLTGIASLALAACCIAGLWVLFPHPPVPPMWVGALLSVGLLLSFGCALLSWRLLRGRGRTSDGVLISSWGLRAGGILLCSMPILLVALALARGQFRGLVALLEAAPFIAMGCTCWALARSRESALQEQGEPRGIRGSDSRGEKPENAA